MNASASAPPTASGADDRGDAAARGRFALWWVTTWPIGVAWMASAHHGGSFLLTSTGIVIAVASRSRPAAGVLGVLELVWLAHLDARHQDVRLVVLAGVAVLLLGIATGALRSRRVARPAVPAGAFSAFSAMCAAASTARRRWLAGEFPRGVTTDRPASAGMARAQRPTATSFLVPVAVWVSTLVIVNASRVVSPPLAGGGGWFTSRGLRRWLGSEFVDNWSQWDSGQYLTIARHGYGYSRPGVYSTADGLQHPMAWFPGYGLVIRWVTAIRSPGSLQGGGSAHEFAVSAVIVSMASGLAVAVLLWTWLTLRGIDGRRRVAVLLCVMWFPYSFFLYGAIYGDGLFLALVLGAFVLVEMDRPLVAGVVAAAAATVRVNGIALIAALVVLLLAHPSVVARYRASFAVLTSTNEHSWARRAMAAVRSGGAAVREQPRLLGAAVLAASGLGGFIVWCGVRYGEPLMYWNAHRALFPSVSPLAVEQVVRVGFLPSLIDLVPGQPVKLVALLVEAALTVLALASVPAVRRRFGSAYAVFVLVQVATIWFSSFDFSGAGRYLLCAFPVAALWGERVAGRRFAPALAAAGGGGLLVLTYYFGHSLDLGW